MLIVWPWEHDGNPTVEWSDPDNGDQWAIVHWTVDGHHEHMTFTPGSPAIVDGTLAGLPLAPGSHSAPD